MYSFVVDVFKILASKLHKRRKLLIKKQGTLTKIILYLSFSVIFIVKKWFLVHVIFHYLEVGVFTTPCKIKDRINCVQLTINIVCLIYTSEICTFYLGMWPFWSCLNLPNKKVKNAMQYDPSFSIPSPSEYFRALIQEQHLFSAWIRSQSLKILPLVSGQKSTIVTGIKPRSF